MGIESHPARFPFKLAKFFIDFLTEPDDIVLDILVGSNTTGLVAEVSQRRWIAFEKEHEYLAPSAFRFLEKNVSKEHAQELYEHLLQLQTTVYIETENISVELQEEVFVTALEPDTIETSTADAILQLGLF